MKTFQITILILIFTLSVFAQRGVGVRVYNPNGREVILYENSYALIIGNNNYKDTSWGNLPGVKADVQAVSEILCKHGFNVEIAENLTGKNFESRIKSFINKYGKSAKNRILIYYAGHGYKQKSVGDRREIGYVVPVDAPNPQKPEFLNYAVTMDTVENYAKEIQSTHALFVFDNCFSGKLVSRNPIVVPDEINEKVGGAVRQFLTSGSPEQEVPDESDFRRAFVRGLEGKADENGDGYTTASELALFIKEALKNPNQSPQYGKIKDDNLNIGDFVFAKPDSKGDCAEKVKDSANEENEEDESDSTTRSPRVVETNFFKFDLKFCKLSGTSLNCSIAVTNQEVDREIGFGNRTTVFDDLGNEYSARKVSVGIKSGSSVYVQLINGVTTTVQFTFENFSPNASKITKFAVYATQKRGTSFNVEYRDISFGRKTRRITEKFVQKIDENNFRFELNGCKKSGSLVYCDLTVINNGVDREIAVGNLTKLFDEAGNNYPASEVNVALKSGRSVSAKFISKVRVKVRFTFANVALETEKIKLLSVVVVPRRGKKFTVDFKDVEFE